MSIKNNSNIEINKVNKIEKKRKSEKKIDKVEKKIKKSKKKINKVEKNKSKKIKKVNNNKKYGIVVLDLDETLFHSIGENSVNYRPHLKDFLMFLNNYFYLVVYTAAVKPYADERLDRIKIDDTHTLKNLFILRLARSAVTPNGKDLLVVLKNLLIKKEENKIKIEQHFLEKIVNKKRVWNLDNIVLIDNLVENFLESQFFNGIPTKDFIKDNDDNGLLLLMKFFKNYLNLVIKKNKKITLKKYLYENLYKLNKILKIEYHKPNC